MGTITINSLDQLEVLIEQFKGEKSPVIDAALKAGGHLARDNMEIQLRHVLSGNSTGELLDSLGVSRVKTSTKRSDRNVKAGFKEPRSKQPLPGFSLRGRAGARRNGNPEARGLRSYYTLTNAMLANVLEHGVTSGTDQWQVERPWMNNANTEVEKHVADVMEKAIEKKLKQILK